METYQTKIISGDFYNKRSAYVCYADNNLHVILVHYVNQYLMNISSQSFRTFHYMKIDNYFFVYLLSYIYYQ